MKVDVIIPTYKPGKEFEELICRLQKQTYSIHRIIIINTQTGVFPTELESEPYQIEIMHISRKILIMVEQETWEQVFHMLILFCI